MINDILGIYSLLYTLYSSMQNGEMGGGIQRERKRQAIDKPGKKTEI